MNLSPYVRIAWYSTLEPHTLLGPRDIFDYELLYLKEGSARITVEGRVYDGNPGDVFLFRPHQRHKIECLNNFPVIQPHVHFDLQYRADQRDVFVSYVTDEEMTPEQKTFFRSDIMDRFYPSIPDQIHLQNSKVFEEYLFDLIDEYNMPSSFTQVRQQWYFMRLFDLYLTEVGYFLHIEGHSNAESIASRMKLYLDNNTSRRVTLEELADVLTRPSPAKRLAVIGKTAQAVLADYVEVVEVVAPTEVPRVVPGDADDDHVIAAAVAETLGAKARIHRIRLLQNEEQGGWARVGRLDIMRSHTTRKNRN